MDSDNYSVCEHSLYVVRGQYRIGAFLLGGTGSRRRRDQTYQELFQQYPEKKKKTIQLIMKIKGQEIKQGVKIPNQVDVTLKDIDLIISEVLNVKPEVAVDVT